MIRDYAVVWTAVVKKWLFVASFVEVNHAMFRFFSRLAISEAP
jgi:hypothetical protein